MVRRDTKPEVTEQATPSSSWKRGNCLQRITFQHELLHPPTHIHTYGVRNVDISIHILLHSLSGVYPYTVVFTR